MFKLHVTRQNLINIVHECTNTQHSVATLLREELKSATTQVTAQGTSQGVPDTIAELAQLEMTKRRACELLADSPFIANAKADLDDLLASLPPSFRHQDLLTADLDGPNSIECPDADADAGPSSILEVLVPPIEECLRLLKIKYNFLPNYNSKNDWQVVKGKESPLIVSYVIKAERLKAYSTLQEGSYTVGEPFLRPTQLKAADEACLRVSVLSRYRVYMLTVKVAQ